MTVMETDTLEHDLVFAAQDGMQLVIGAADDGDGALITLETPEWAHEMALGRDNVRELIAYLQGLAG